MHLNSQLLFEKHAKSFFKNDMKVLEIGADQLPTWYSRTVNKPSIDWYTLDIKTHWDTLDIGNNKDLINKQILSEDEYNYPLDNNSFDIIFSGQVIEHVKNIWKWMEELKRITKPGGVIIILSPISWPYHVAPMVSDCWRIYPDGMKALAEEKGLNIIHNSFESMEKELIPLYVPTYPGIGIAAIDDLRERKSVFFYNRILSFIPLLRKYRVPQSVSYDAVFILSKK
jgi:SAM-dependent methyltransferase